MISKLIASTNRNCISIKCEINKESTRKFNLLDVWSSSISHLSLSISSLLVHGVNRNLPVLGVLLWVICKTQIVLIFFVCFHICSCTCQNQSFYHKKLIVVLDHWVQYVGKVWCVCQFVPVKSLHSYVRINRFNIQFNSYSQT